MIESEHTLLAELKTVLGNLYDQNDSKNKELIDLIRSILKRVESAEHELFNSTGSVNDLRSRITVLEGFVEDKEIEDKDKKAFVKSIFTKALASIVTLIAVWALAKFGWFQK